jgi:hypothetical protein
MTLPALGIRLGKRFSGCSHQNRAPPQPAAGNARTGPEIFCRQGAQLLSCDGSPRKGHLFGTADNQPLPMPNRTNKFRGFEQRVMAARIAPSVTADGWTTAILSNSESVTGGMMMFNAVRAELFPLEGGR